MKTSMVLAIALLCVGLASCDHGPITLTIGMIVAQTGPSAARGKDLVEGAILAADQINAERLRIDGRTLEIKIMAADDQGDVARAKDDARDLLDAQVDAVIGPLNTNQSAAVVPLIAAHGIPQLITATGASLTTLGKGNVLRLLANDKQQGRAMAVFAAETLHARRLGLVVEKSDYGRGLAAAFASAASAATMRPVASFEIADTGQVGADTVKSFKAAQVDTIVVFARELQLTSLLTQLDAAGWKAVSVLGTNVIRNKQMAERELHVAGLYATATAIDAKEFPDGHAFLDAFSKRFGSKPVWGAQYS